MAHKKPCLEYMSDDSMSFSMIVDDRTAKLISRSESSHGTNLICPAKAPSQNPQNSKSIVTEIQNYSKPTESTNLVTTSIQPRQRSSWVDDKSVEKCYACHEVFSFYVRRHHCRQCGHIYCDKCSTYRMTIPEQVGSLPTENLSLIAQIPNLLWSSSKVRMCRICAQRIITLKKLDTWLKVFDLVSLTVNDYRKMTQVSHLWNQIGNHYLSKFREIQYKLPGQKHSDLEKRMLWNHREMLWGHSLWLLSLIQSMENKFREAIVPLEQNEFHEMKVQNLQNPQKFLKRGQETTISCRRLMCSRLCQGEISGMETILLLEKTRSVKAMSFKKTILDRLNESSIQELGCYIPLLVGEMGFETHQNNAISHFLLDLAKKDTGLAGEIYWEWKIKLNNPKLSESTREIYRFFSEKLLKVVNADTRVFLEDSERLILFLNLLPRQGTLEQIQTLFVQNEKLFHNLRVPTHPQLICHQIVIDQITIKDSASRPIFLPLKCYHTGLKRNCDYFLLYKFEDIRQDQIVIKTIRLMDLILKKELGFSKKTGKQDLDIQVITYNVLPTSSRSGLIEIIPNCQTLFEIQKGFSIFNYILENNRDKHYSADQLRQRFLKSSAAYCVITYLLGVGDRHLENIMVTKSGYLFHIDYGFIIGSDPKPMNRPTMRITPDMVDALGGDQSEYYKQFITLSQQIHHCLRRRLPIFLTLLSLLVTIEPPIKQSDLTVETLRDELVKRFMYGETYEQAQIQLCIQINSSSQSYKGAMVDFLHYHNRENTIPSLITGTVNWVGSFFRS